MEKPSPKEGIFEAYLIPWSRRLLKIPYLKALRETFCIMMPLIIMLALLNMAGSLVLNPLGPVMSDEGLGLGTFLSGGLHGQTYRDSNFFQLMMNFADFINVISFLYYLAFSIIFTGQLSRIWRTDKMLSILCTLTSYVFLLAIFNDGLESVSLYFKGRGFFISLLISTVSVLSFRYFCRVGLLRTAPMAVGLSPRLRYSMSRFMSLGATILVCCSLVFVWILFEKYLSPLSTVIQENFSMELAQNPAVAMCYEFCRRLLWWLGLNGNGLTFFWAEAFYLPAQAANALEGGRYIFTREFFDAVSISLLGLAISIWVFSNQSRLRSISAYSFPTLLLSVNEPFLFALPIVLNPLFLVPYLLAPMANVLLGYLAIDYGIVPVFKYAVDSTAPVFLGGIVGTGDIMGAVLQLVWLSVDIIIYTPFVIVFNLLHPDDDSSYKEVRDI